MLKRTPILGIFERFCSVFISDWNFYSDNHFAWISAKLRDGTWVWGNPIYEDISYTPWWANGDPNGGNCMLVFQGQMADDPCESSTKMGVLCEITFEP